MRKSQPTIGRRLLRAGIATGAVSAVLFAAAPPAFAANIAVTLSPNAGPVNAATTITATGTGLATDSTTSAMIDVRFVTATTCPTTNGSPSATSIAATGVTRDSANAVTFTTPNPLGTAPATYRVCIYGVTTGTPGTTAPLIGNASTATTAFRTFTSGTLSATTGPTSGGNTITISGTGVVGTGATVAATFTSGACSGTYATSGTSFAATSTVKNTADQATITVPATATAAGGPYRVCLYNGSTAGTSLLLASATATYQPAFPQAILSSSTGKNGGGNTITATLSGAFTGITPSVVFVNDASPCPTTYGTPTAGTVATVTNTDDVATITVPSGVLAPNGFNVCFYNGSSSSSGQIAAGNATYVPTLPSIVLSPDSGSTATATTITATSTGTSNFLLGVTSPGVTFTKSACPTTYATSGTNFAASSVIRISNNKAAITVPTTVVHTPGATSTTSWNTCIYSDASSGPLVGTAVYKVGAVLTVTAISPGSGPAQGGSSVLVTGTGFTPGMTASIGGAAINNIVVAPNGLTFTGTTTPRSSGTGLGLTVRTEAGSKTLASAYDYSFGITVMPNTAPAGSASVTLDVLGAGFETIGFASPTVPGNNADAHVYLVRSGAGAATAYDPTDNGSGGKTVPQIAECTNVLVISDLELLCTLNLTDTLTNAATPASAGTPVPEGTYTITVVDTGAVTPTAGVTKSKITSGSTFTVADY
ncbi:IPT/TIG domain-containing protein [Catenuloplanes indicus]|uniref:IPT/TIG domain-containing protein n=1 Tax=Catenuloplanes indicus TaxID=137267 RepID=A0AAE3W290_9ACTN|nr:IPT/TIG domain-containing protein [Catenuloplanes indicus]MDQ0368139.1 hypothetical protein [Catenuloplanes indicus]